MIVRGTRTRRAVPAAPGILRNTAEHVMVLDYGTAESLEFIRAHAGEIAAVLVEPVAGAVGCRPSRARWSAGPGSDCGTCSW